MSGLFITFEGVEGSGKSTQMALLAEALALHGHEVITTREPGGTPIGEEIRRILLSPESVGMTPEAEALLYAAARAQHVAQVIRPALEEGVVVICDRYLDSSLVYQGIARGLGRNTIGEVNRLAIGGLLPKRTYYLRVPVEQALERAVREAADRIELEGLEFHRKVDEGFRELANIFPQRILVVDGEREPDEVAKELLADAERLLERN